MAPVVKVKKEDILNAALQIARTHGVDSVNARLLASELNISTQPIFSNYSSMEELKDDVIKSAYGIYSEFINNEMSKNIYPVYKASGIGYIEFAKQEPELFKLLFMRTRNKTENEAAFDFSQFTDIIRKNLGISEEDATRFHMETWIYVHGIASMCVTGYLDLDTETVSDMLTDIYMGLKHVYQERGKNE